MILAALVALAVVLAGVLIVQARDTGSVGVVGSTGTSAVPTTAPLGGATSSSPSSTSSVPAAPSTTKSPSAGDATGTTAPSPLPTVSPSTQPTVQETTPPTSLGACTSAQADSVVATDKPSYTAGEPVNVTATVRNRSTTPCTVADADSSCYSLLGAYSPSDSRPFWRSGALPALVCRGSPRRTLLPGASTTLSAAWDQTDRRSCSGYAPSPTCVEPRIPGLYSIQSSWLADVATTTVQLL